MNERPDGWPKFLESWQTALPFFIVAAILWSFLIGSLVLGFTSWIGIP